ncbi:uncharacterized protein LOC119780485 [Cyprinodon tularosa]|uniref:uncharacterized protein LOC119780485 n=1 Tax=Cyprinodon tularosa TaxID=77115 RepID=UPI0018E20879|nr:uncharacterized protein LOC119780485 [Cyprinodon tularosa]
MKHKTITATEQRSNIRTESEFLPQPNSFPQHNSNPGVYLGEQNGRLPPHSPSSIWPVYQTLRTVSQPAPTSLAANPLHSPSSVWPVHQPARPLSQPAIAPHATVHPPRPHPFREQGAPSSIRASPQLQALSPRQQSHTDANGERDRRDTSILNERSDQPACSSTPTEAGDSQPLATRKVLKLRRSSKRRKENTSILNERSDQPACSSTPAEAGDSQPLATRKVLKVRRSSNQTKESK